MDHPIWPFNYQDISKLFLISWKGPKAQTSWSIIELYILTKDFAYL